MINFITKLFKTKKKEIDPPVLNLEEKLLADGYVHLKGKNGKKVYAKNGHRVII